MTTLGKVSKADTPARRLVPQNEVMLDAALSDAVEQRARNHELSRRLSDTATLLMEANAINHTLAKRLIAAQAENDALKIRLGTQRLTNRELTVQLEGLRRELEAAQEVINKVGGEKLMQKYAQKL